MRIIIDTMGADNSPRAQVEGAIMAAGAIDAQLILVGDEGRIRGLLDANGYYGDKITVVHADEVITNDEDPALAVRRKKNASITVAAKLLKDGEGDALVSMGSTGAVLAAALLIVGRIKGVIRPAMAPVIPTEKGPSVLIDCGANADCRAAMLCQFGIMGSIYSENILGKKSPAVGLVNIGAEAHKGNKLAKETYPLLSKSPVNFAGNCEARDILNGKFDVIVTDGFTGNVILKLVEGAASTLFGSIKSALMQNLKSKIGAVMIKSSLMGIKKRFDYSEHGGALFLGVKKPVIKGHGSSDAKAVFSAVRQAYNCVEADIIGKIEADISKMGDMESDEKNL